MRKGDRIKPIRAIVYGLGSAGRQIPRCMLQKGIQIVGAIGHSNPNVVGKDLGAVCGLDHPLNVVVSADADRVLSEQEADIVVVSLFTQLERVYPHFKICIENGLNVISLSEEAHYPWISSRLLASKLDELAKQYGVTVAGSGSQDTVMVGMPSLLASGCHLIESLTSKLHWSPDDYGPVVAEHAHIGETMDEFYQKIKKGGPGRGLSSWQAEAVIADLSLTIERVERQTSAITANEDMESKSLGRVVRKGEVIGTNLVTDYSTEQRITFHVEEIGKLRREGDSEAYTNEWFIEGEPENLYLRCKRAPSVVAAALVHRIPDVINSKPGLVTFEGLPKLKYRAYPLHFYCSE